MFQYIISQSVKHKLLVGLFICSVIIAGVYSFTRIPIDAVPDITNNQVQVITNSPTLAAQEVEQFITYPLELSLRNIPGVIEIRSISRFSISVITVVFKDDINTYLARQLVDEKIKAAGEQIPAEFGKPGMAPVTTGLGEIYQYVLKPEKGYEHKYDLMDMRTVQDWIVKRQLSGTEGVVDVSSFGGYEKQYEVAVNPERLNSQGITITDILNALKQNNENTGAAYIEKDHNAYFIRGEGISRSEDDLKNIVVKTVNGLPVLIRDIAEVGMGHAARYGAMTYNADGEVVGGIVLMLKGANSADVISKVKERIAGIQKSLPEGLRIEPYLDRTTLIDNTFRTVARNLAEGALIVIFVLVLLVGNFRAGLIIASVIPLSMLFALILMNIFGVSANLMSLGALDFGLIVDGAVIVVEGVLYHLHTRKADTVLSHSEMDEQVISSASGIMTSAAFGVLIILIVYVPILSLTGIEGKMFKPMAQTVGFALTGALIFSLTYVPVMSALFLGRKVSVHRNISDRIMGRIEKLHRPVFHFAFKRKFMILAAALLLLAASAAVFMSMGGEFIPTLEEGDFAVEYKIAPGSSLSQAIETEQKAAAILKARFPEVRGVVGKLGTAEIATDPMPIETGDIMVLLKKKSEWITADNREELAGRMKEALSELPGASFEFQQPIQMRFNELISGVRSDVAVKIFGEDLDVLHEKAGEVAVLIQNIKGVADIKVEQLTGQPQIVVRYNREKVSRYGLNIHDLNETLRAAMAGENAGVIFEGEKKFDIVVRFEKDYRRDIENLKNLYVKTPEGSQVPMGEVADIDYKEAPSQISRDDTRRRIVIGINVRNRDVESVVKDICARLDKSLKLPPGYSITYGGQFENLQAAKKRLSVAVPLALILIFLLLFIAFGSVRESALIFAAIPFSAIGGVFALALRGMPFSISAGVGFIALFGVAVLNGIVLIASFKRSENEMDADAETMIYESTRVRLRPVLMTAAVASLGFLPMAISTSSGAEVQRPLATVVIGGLVTSTLLTLIVLPLLYSLFRARKRAALPCAAIVVPLIMLMAGTTLPASAQKFAYQPFTLQQAIDTALKHHPDMQTATLKVKKQQQLRNSTTDLPKTTLYRNAEAERESGAYGNVYYGVKQEFLFPGVYARQAKVHESNLKLSENEYIIRRAALVKQVRIIYYDLLIAKAKLRLYQSLDSIYAGFEAAAALKYSTGETGKLEKLSASAKYQQIKLNLQAIQADVENLEKQLQLILNIKASVTIAEKEPEKLPFADADTAALKTSPGLAWYGSAIYTANTQAQLEKAKYGPDFSFGYAIQQFAGYGSFPAVYAEISIPLWFSAQQSKVQAAKIQVKIAESEYQNYRLQQNSAYLEYRQQALKYRRMLAYYEKQGLALSDEILKASNLSYKAGETSYTEHVQNLEQYISIRLAWLESLNEYNQAVINIYNIQGQ